MPKIPDSARGRFVGWNSRRILVYIKDPDSDEVSTERIWARCKGMLSIHRSVNGSGRWVITSLTTGRLIVSVSEEQDALRIAKVLDSRFGRYFRLRTPGEIREAIPPWVIKWCQACYQKEKFLLPELFEEVV